MISAIEQIKPPHQLRAHHRDLRECAQVDRTDKAARVLNFANYGMMNRAVRIEEPNRRDLPDLGHPNVGIEGIERLREIFPETPIIALTISA